MSRRPPLSWSSMQISSINRSGWWSGIGQTSGPNRSRLVRSATAARKNARRWRHAERRRVMLGDVIGVETGAIVGLGDLEAILVIVRERTAVAIEMIKDTELHFFNACADRPMPRALRLRLQLFPSLRQCSQP